MTVGDDYAKAQIVPSRPGHNRIQLTMSVDTAKVVQALVFRVGGGKDKVHADTVFLALEQCGITHFGVEVNQK